ncbi:hypothetical protein G3341_06335 [Providencia vermicola]|uniref:hypothetical protein n=1 Tax=Providencia vermicola TaxID=333965 RepID=UPI0013A737DD|nr:hypothetical protein [Providencia vermicola]QIC15350.1 hypothetical protein G3341_06335 [Providencia vermicola]
MKRNIDDFDGMKDFIISIVGAVAWFLVVAIITIGYFTIDTKGESIMLSYTSTIFTIISSISILVTILTYHGSKKHNETIEIKRNELNAKKSIHFIKQETIFLKKLLEDNISAFELLMKIEYEKLTIFQNNNTIAIYIFLKEDDPLYTTSVVIHRLNGILNNGYIEKLFGIKQYERQINNIESLILSIRQNDIHYDRLPSSITNNIKQAKYEFQQNIMFSKSIINNFDSVINII